MEYKDDRYWEAVQEQEELEEKERCDSKYGFDNNHSMSFEEFLNARK